MHQQNTLPIYIPEEDRGEDAFQELAERRFIDLI